MTAATRRRVVSWGAVRQWAAAEGAPLLAIWAVVAVIWLSLAVPLALGERTLIARDVFTTHLHLKAIGASELAHGRIPAFNQTWGLGQPFRGNPNAVAFYPGNLLYLALPFWSAFNLHFVLHWLLALAGMRGLARALGQSRPAALLAGITYAGSGFLLNALSYYNILVVVAWWPAVLWGAVRGDRRGLWLAGVACGLALLGGEPVTAAVGLLPLLLVCVTAAGWRQGVTRVVAVGLLGLAVALPQVVATWRVLPFTYRVAHGLDVLAAPLSQFPLARLVELVVPFPFGRPWEMGAAGFLRVLLPRVPYVATIYTGVVGLLLAAVAARRHARWALLAAAGLAGAWVLTLIPGSVEGLTFGLARYPERLLLWSALALPLLAGWGLELALADGERLRRWARGCAAATTLVAVASVAGYGVVAGWIAERAPQTPAAHLPIIVGIWVLYLFGAALLAQSTGWAARRGSPVGLLALQLAGLLQLYHLLPTDEVGAYREPAPFRRLLPADAAVFNGTFLTVLGEDVAPHRFGGVKLSLVRRTTALDLLPAPGVLHGLRYPLAPDFDGMDSLPVGQLLLAFPAFTWSQRVRWLQVFGVDAAVLARPGSGVLPAELEPLASAEHEGLDTGLYAVAGRNPRVWWPRRLLGASSPAEAMAAVGELTAAGETAIVAAPAPAHDRDGAVRLLSESADRLVFETRGAGGVVALTRAYQPILRATREDGRGLETLPLDFALLGVLVPPGAHTVTVDVDSRPELLAGMVALLALALALLMARRSRSVAPPAA